tara:strand:+ start:79 stop:216 length:138 start_codon:yes stop_codon:yes gene_type:complete
VLDRTGVKFSYIAVRSERQIGASDDIVERYIMGLDKLSFKTKTRE